MFLRIIQDVWRITITQDPSIQEGNCRGKRIGKASQIHPQNQGRSQNLSSVGLKLPELMSSGVKIIEIIKFMTNY